MSRREIFVEAADVALPLVEHELVAKRWTEPSALPRMSVGALATHLAGQVVSAHAALAAPSAASRETPLPVLEHYQRSKWVTAALDDEANVNIREGAEHTAEEGRDAVVERLQRSLASLRAWSGDTPPTVRMPWWEWSLSMDDFLLTRMLEVVVHSDDLAVSLDVPTPEFPRAVVRPVLTLLTTLAVRRHGQPAVLRALTRSERAPASLAVF
ncbi:maleylpyruvate isomerase N-terminal domain-containing protein [Nocardioides mesophilus]|uniref:Maleylpyruvate isomerase N-terminal domain-containing protein n=1 Tax=Nocardioides mesophilus TaxID=433659 RepID=A0A7G9RF22_9ACTN|nr:maleylpyruvate isomerase N-terminal domain-containing protein [Nocardioides mesophilus]QNN54197.1 maleylpyruvate isomerase N-terminal domain-containing protein [Nocardioides mesophilus]